MWRNTISYIVGRNDIDITSAEDNLAISIKILSAGAGGGEEAGDINKKKKKSKVLILFDPLIGIVPKDILKYIRRCLRQDYLQL